MAEFAFDSSEVEPSQPFTVLPKGKYEVIVSNTVMRATKAGDGQMISVEYTIIDGEYEGRKVFDNLNIVNKSADAENIARRNLSALCGAVGIVRRITDTEELHDKPLIIEVGVEKRRDTGEDTNRVKAWIANGAPKAEAKPEPAKAPTKAAPPWAKHKAA